MSIAEAAMVDELAGRILAASAAGRPMAPITDQLGDFGLAAAYAVSAEVERRRIARGERPVGWKIGFTNRTIWDEYNVHAPIWGRVYDTTLTEVLPGRPASCAIARLAEPRIEPEIAFRMARTPDPDMDAAELMECIGAVAHSFEIVQSLFPGWRFRAADTVAAFALHGRLFVGPFTGIRDERARAEWLRRLTDFEIVLSCDGKFVDRGHGTNVLDGPVHALRHFIHGLAETSGGRLAPGEIVTTGTITRAFAVGAGETWSTEIAGLPLAGLRLAVA